MKRPESQRHPRSPSENRSPGSCADRHSPSKSPCGCCWWPSIVAMRVYLWQLLPAYVWSRDAGSYAGAAFHWLDTGVMTFDGRRGPVYTLLIAAALKLFGTVNGVVWLQHALGGLAIFAVVLTARIGWGRISVLPLFVCGVCLAAYGLPLHLGHLIRNESTLFILSSAALCSWWLALKWNSKAWLFAAAVSVAVLTMTKNVFVPFPLVLVGGCSFLKAMRAHPPRSPGSR